MHGIHRTFEVTFVVTDQVRCSLHRNGFPFLHGTRNIEHIVMTIFSQSEIAMPTAKEYKHGNKYRTCAVLISYNDQK